MTGDTFIQNEDFELIFQINILVQILYTQEQCILHLSFTLIFK